MGFALSISCQASHNQGGLDIQGHRGCRGLMPENTIPAFIKAMELGVTTLEMDLVISSDKQVVVSHEPYFKADFTTPPNGIEITKETQKEFNIFQMTYDSIQTYDVGSKFDPAYPESVRMKVAKPLYSQVIKEVSEWCEKNGNTFPFLNIEIKRVSDMDHMYHPGVEEFVDLVLAEVNKSGVKDKTIIQSFDLESLQVVREKQPEIPLALLIMNRKSPEENIDSLGFTPEIYSCYYKLVDASLIDLGKAKNIKIIPWTVNEPSDIDAMLTLGVDGIISDYPDRVINKIK